MYCRTAPNIVKEQTSVLNFKISGYLKFYFFNGWNEPLKERPEKVGTCPALVEMCSSYQCLFGGRESCIHGYSYQTNNFEDPLRTVVNGLTKCFTKTVGIFLNKLSRDHYYKKNHETILSFT